MGCRQPVASFTPPLPPVLLLSPGPEHKKGETACLSQELPSAVMKRSGPQTQIVRKFSTVKNVAESVRKEGRGDLFGGQKKLKE